MDDTEFARPDDELLASYASGALSPGMSLLVATQLTFDPVARERVGVFEALGGALLKGEAPVEAPSLSAVLSRLDEAPQEAAPPPPSAGDPALPRPVTAALGGAPRWRFRFPGISECVLEGFGEDEEVSLLRARPGAPLLSHTHTGPEATLVLTGELSDRGRVYRRGEVAFADDSDDHRPQVVGEEVCICLIVLSGDLRFTGPLSRALNLF